MTTFRTFLFSSFIIFFNAVAYAQDDMGLVDDMGQPIDDIAALTERGKELYFEQVSCWVCHGDDAEGRVGPTITYGPTPVDIQLQLDQNPQMGIIVTEINPDATDLVALSTYLTGLDGEPATLAEVKTWREELAGFEAAKAAQQENYEFVITPRDQQVIGVQSYDTVLEDWQRKSPTGSLKRDYEVRVTRTFEPAEQKFFPEPGGVYFYENTGPSARQGNIEVPVRTRNTQVVVGDAITKEVITYTELPDDLRGLMHTTVMSADGKYVYIVGPPTPDSGTSNSMAMGGAAGAGRGTATLLKIDALTLQPVKQMEIGGRMHHGQLFQDRYILIDTFVRDPDGMDVMLFDTVTDTITGGVQTADLGGSNYTSFHDNEYIYILMQPPSVQGGNGGAQEVARGLMTTLRPYWVAKVDPVTWEVVQEYPYPGFRGDWIIFDAAKEYFYVPTAGTSNVAKINMQTGELEWSTPSGIGPYGGTLNADETELWVSNKGEATGAIGRTLTVIETSSGRGMETVFSGYKSDHVLLSPNGKEMWVTSNGEGRIYVFDAKTREQLKVIDMPHNGDPHGLVWVKYDEDGVGRVVRDQGGFHGGVNPALGKPLEY